MSRSDIRSLLTRVPPELAVAVTARGLHIDLARTPRLVPHGSSDEVVLWAWVPRIAAAIAMFVPLFVGILLGYALRRLDLMVAGVVAFALAAAGAAVAVNLRQRRARIRLTPKGLRIGRFRARWRDVRRVWWDQTREAPGAADTFWLCLRTDETFLWTVGHSRRELEWLCKLVEAAARQAQNPTSAPPVLGLLETVRRPPPPPPSPRGPRPAGHRSSGYVRPLRRLHARRHPSRLDP